MKGDTNMEDFSSILPNGEPFVFWERETNYTRELHVDRNASNASDDNDGGVSSPFLTINAAAKTARPGDRVLVHAGVYRETVRPEISGGGPESMICYEAFGDGEVIIKASVAATEFIPSEGWHPHSRNAEPKKIWTVKLNPEDFKGYNPFCAINAIHDRVYLNFGDTDPTPFLNRRGMVFVDGKPMVQVPLYNRLTDNENAYWVEANGQTVHFRLKNDGDPKDHLIELTCREQCFAPEVPFLSYIKVKGFTMVHASMGAPVPQRGAISCGRGHHWIIEDCVIDWSNAVGIDIGNECWHRTGSEEIHAGNIIRRTMIKDAGVCGIAGIVSEDTLIEDNLIVGAGWQLMEKAYESAGIKLHHAKNNLIRRNVVRDCFRCDSLWLDYGNKNNRVTGNLFLNGDHNLRHLYIECNRNSENMIDNNVIWGAEGWCGWDKPQDSNPVHVWYSDAYRGDRDGYGIYLDGSEETRIVNNLIGRCNGSGFNCYPVAMRMAEGRGGTNRNTRIFNNIFYECAEAAIKLDTPHNEVEGNVYAKMRRGHGYLFMLNPAPIMCLDLDAWRRFCGFDLTGAAADMDIHVDAENLTIKIIMKEPLTKNKSDAKIKCGFGGEPTREYRAAGPFEGLEEGTHIFSIDPRRV